MTSSPRHTVDHYVTDLGDGQASALVELGVTTGPNGFTPDEVIGQNTVDRYELTSFEALRPVAGAGPIFEFTGPTAKIRRLVAQTIR